jgi:hypothetical protein
VQTKSCDKPATDKFDDYRPYTHPDYPSSPVAQLFSTIRKYNIDVPLPARSLSPSYQSIFATRAEFEIAKELL